MVFIKNMASLLWLCAEKIDCINLFLMSCRYVGALTGIINIALFLFPGFFKEFDANKVEQSNQKVYSLPPNQEVTDGLQKKRRELLRQNTTFSIVSVDGKTMAASPPSKHLQPSTSFWGKL